jgi:oligosaccharide repeat unit polymerase
MNKRLVLSKAPVIIFVCFISVLLVFLINFIPHGLPILPVSLALILFLLILLGYFLMAKSETGHKLLYPSTIFSFFYFILYVVMTFDLLYLRGYVGSETDISLIVEALLIATLGLATFIFGYIIPLGKIPAKLYPAFSFRWKHKKVIVVVITLIVTSVGILWYIVRDTGGLYLYLSNLVYKRDIFFQRSYLLALITQINIALYLIFSYWLDTKRGGWYLLLTALIAMIVLILINSRISFFVFTLSLLFIYISKGRKVNWLLLAGLAVGLPVFAVIYGSVIREFIPYGVNAIKTLGSNPGFGESLRAFWDRLAPENFDSLTRLTLVLNYVPSIIDFIKGRSFLGIVTFLIPRFLYPDKPNGIGVIFTQVFYPISYLNKGGRTPSLLVDFYWNFGLAGVAIGMFLFGIFLRSIAEYAWTHRNQAGPTIISAIMISQIFGWLKAGSDTPTQAVIGNLVIWILIMIFFKFGKRKKTSLPIKSGE